MGNSSTKLAERCSLLTRGEVPVVASSFKIASKNSDKVKEDELKKFWSTQMDPRLSQYITNFLFGPLGNRSPHVDFQRFAELYVYCVRGTIDERTYVLMQSLGQGDQEHFEIAYPLIKEVSRETNETLSESNLRSKLFLVRRGRGQQLHAGLEA